MQSTLRRLTALILALSMCFSLLSTSAWAADTSADGSGDPAVSSTEPQEGEPEEAEPEGNAEEAAPEGEAKEPEAEEPEPVETETKPKEEQPKPKMKAKKQSAMSLTAQDTVSNVSYREGKYENSTLSFSTKTADCTVVQDSTDAVTWSAGWYVVEGADVTITSRITVDGTTNLILCDGAKLTASAGITVQNGKTLNIYAQSEGDGAGALIATGSTGKAGIGGESSSKGTGTINIHGGIIDATSKTQGAGIGGGNRDSAGGTVNIYGGAVTAKGGSGGAAIGGGRNGSCGSISIHGGTVEANGVDGGGAAIGDGSSGAGGKITITGGVVNATGGYSGAAIGSDGTGGEITINGGTVTAKSGGIGAGIGGSASVAGGTITINGGTVTATGGSTETRMHSAGIGGGANGAGGEITINGGIVTATGGNEGAGIGGGSSGAGGTITINGGTVTATGGSEPDRAYCGAGIGGGDSGAGGTITINGGTVTATGGKNAVGIGAGYGNADNGTLTLGTDVKLETSTDGETWTDTTNDTSIRTQYMKTSKATAPAPVSYLKWNDTTKALEEQTGENACKTYEVVTDSTENDSWSDGVWYVVKGEVTITGSRSVYGTVNLILCDGAKLTVTKGLAVDNRNNKTLNIYAQSEGDSAGKLIVTSKAGSAGIGGASSNSGGTINIHGGNIETTGGSSAAGIGGGSRSAVGTITIYGGTVTANGNEGGAGIGGGRNAAAGGTVTIHGGTVTANGSSLSAGIGGGNSGAGGEVIITGGTVIATGSGNVNYGGAGIGGGGSSANSGTGGNVTISGGTVTAIGATGAAGIGGGNEATDNGTLKVATSHVVYSNDSAITDTNKDSAKAKAQGTGDTALTITRYPYMLVEKGTLHTHDFTYSASGATITATCTADGCTLPPSTEGGTDHIATLTLAATGGTYDGTTAYGATITDANSLQGDAKVQYQKKTDGSYGTATETAPKDAGDYKASITVGGATASVEYIIAQADPTANAPTGLTATYGQTLANVSLEGKNPEGNTPGTWAWADSTKSVGNVVTPAATFKAIFTPDSSNYKTVENVEVTVTVNKAANPATVTGTATVIKGGNTVDLANNVTKNGATGDVGYAIDGEANGCTLNGSVLTSGDTTGTVTVNVTVATDSNYEALAATPITVTIIDKGTQTITASDVTATYGDTDKKVNASVTNPATGGGTLSYEVTSGDAVTVNADTGALTIVKAGTAVVTVTAAETQTYAQTTKDVTVTVAQREVGLSWTDTVLTYNGEAQKPVAVATGLLTGDTCTVNVTGEQTNAGTHTATAESLSNESYTLPSIRTREFSISRKGVSITGLSAENKTYDGTTTATVTGTAVINGILGSDSLEVVPGTAAFADKNVGNGKSVSFTGYSLSGTDAGNYNLTAQPASVTANITKKDVTITGLGASNKTYDGTTTATVTGTAVVEGKEDGDTVTVTAGSAAFADKNAGNDKSVSFTGYSLSGTDAGNYSLTAQPASVKANITAKSVTVTPDEKSTAYGEAIAALTYTVSGLVNESDRDSLHVKLTTTATNLSPAGTYPITGEQESGFNTNYAVTFDQTKKYTINQADAAITASSYSGTYDGQAHSISVSVTDPREGGLGALLDKIFGEPAKKEATVYYSTNSSLSSTNYETVGSTVNPTFTDVGETTVYYAVVFGGNYTADPVIGSQTVAITRKDLTITANNQNVAYNGSFATGTDLVTCDTLVGNDELTEITLTLTNDNTIVPSDAKIMQNGEDKTQNYNISYANGTFSKSAAPAPAPAPTPTPGTITIPVSGEGETVNVTVQVSGSTATVTSADVDKVLNAEKVGTVTVNVSSLPNTVDEVVLPTELVEKVAEAVADNNNDASGLEIKLPTGTVTFDAQTVAALAQQSNGKDLKVHLDNVSQATLTSAQQTTVKDMNALVVLDAYVTADGKRISNFNGGTATISVPVELKDGQAAKGVVAWYLADDGTKQAVPCTYDGKNANVGAPHFSHYVIAYDAAKAAEPQPEPQPQSKKKTDINNGLKLSEKNGVVIFSYGEVSDADSYVVYFRYCGTTSRKPLMTVQGAANTTVTIKEFGGKKINRKNSYTAWVVAKKDGEVLATSAEVHAAGSKNKGVTNAKSVKVKKSAVTLKKGKKSAIKVTVKKAGKGKLHKSTKIAQIRYSTSNKKVATVSKKGTIKAVGKGTCKIKVMALNGVCTYVTVTVK